MNGACACTAFPGGVDVQVRVIRHIGTSITTTVFSHIRTARHSGVLERPTWWGCPAACPHASTVGMSVPVIVIVVIMLVQLVLLVCVLVCCCDLSVQHVAYSTVGVIDEIWCVTLSACKSPSSMVNNIKCTQQMSTISVH